MTEDRRQEEQEFSFVKERIKRQPIYQNKMFRKAVFQIALAVLCGVIACFVFVKIYPWMDETFGKKEAAEITLPREEEAEVMEEESTEPPEPIVITETQELEVEDYKGLYRKLRAIAIESEKSLVTVTAASSDTDWFNETYESKNQLSGVLVGNNGVELLVLTAYSELDSADSLQVTFADGVTRDAALKNYDRVTDLAVLSVNLADVPESTLGYVKMASLGSSRALRSGEPVIAVGSPAGVSSSVLYGNLAVADYKAGVIDGEYTLLITDIARTANSSGVLLNLDGQVIGLIENQYLNSNNKDALTAYGISDMKSVIEHLSNNKDLVYIGIMGTDVTSEAASLQGIPDGVYVTKVELDSPAMDAGLQAGDIITEISGKEINSMSSIQEMLLKFSRDQLIQVTVMRQGKEGYQEIPCRVALEKLK